MPIQTINHVALHYDARGHRTKPSLVFTAGRLRLRMQVEALQRE